VNDLLAAAFGPRPDLAIDTAPARPYERWLAAVVLGGQGRYAAAAALLDELRTHDDPVLAALGASALAAHRRQLGGHAAARVLDAAGLGRLAAAGLVGAPGLAAEATSDVLLGLAADAVGVARTEEARRLVATAARIPAGWRGAVRLGWVRAEIELAAGRADLAVDHAAAAVELAAGTDARRHQVKSAIVHGTALATRNAGADRSRARDLLRQALDDCHDLGLASLAWPCGLVLAEVAPDRRAEICRGAGVALHRVLRQADPVGRRLAERSPWVPEPAGPTG
jgi:hypothetical protein